MKKVSVIVPVYNTEKYLAKCLDSLVNQTLKDIEIIVVNDGSPDNSQNMIDLYAAEFPQVKAFKKPNGGLGDARNFGIDRAKGEFIAFVDSDDFIDESMFEKMYRLAKKHGSDIVVCDLEKVNEKGKSFRDLPQSPQLPEKIDLKNDFSIFGEMSCFACNKLFKSELFDTHRFQKGIHFEDVELIPKLFLEARLVSKINEPLYKYFERQESISKTHTEKGLDMFIAIENVRLAFRKSKFSNETEEWKRFVILQGFYSYLAYVAFVKNREVKKKMLDELEKWMKHFEIQKSEVVSYRRFNENYLFSLPLKKRLFYVLALIHKHFILFVK